MDEKIINEAMENRFDGIESCVIVEEILGLEAENKALRKGDESLACWMDRVHEVEVENERLREGFELYFILSTQQNFTSIETLKKVEKFLGNKYELENLMEDRIISKMMKAIRQAFKEAQ